MREHVSATSPVGSRVAAVHGAREHFRRLRIQQTPTDALDACPNTLAWNRAPHEDDLPLMARQHAAPGDRLLYLDCDL